MATTKDCPFPVGTGPPLAGTTVRRFVGEYFSFIVVICSDALEQPRPLTADIVDLARRQQTQFNLVIWIQHNRRTRSDVFVKGIQAFAPFKPLVLIDSPNAGRPDRYDNYAVSGAILPHFALPSHHRLMDRAYRYVEPFCDQSELARLVLLRYDAFAYRTETALPDSIDPTRSIQKSVIYRDADPYSYEASRLVLSSAPIHLLDLLDKIIARSTSKAPGLVAPLIDLRDRLAALGLPAFLTFLDLGIPPKPADERERHLPHGLHPNGAYRCLCWEHRKCIDLISSADAAIDPIVELLLAAAQLGAAGIPVVPFVDADCVSNCRVDLGTDVFTFSLVNALGMDRDAIERALRGGREVRVAEPPYIILGNPHRAIRPSSLTINAARAPESGPISAGVDSVPPLRAAFFDELQPGFADGSARELLRARFAA